VKTPVKLILVQKYIHLSNKQLAKLLYGEVNTNNLSKVRVLKHRAKKLLKSNGHTMKAYIPVSFNNFSHLSFKDYEHYETTSAFFHDSVNDLNLRYLADVAGYVNSRTMNNSHFEALLFQYLQYYINHFERNKKENIKLYVDTNKNMLRGHHKNKALLYYIIIIVYCKHYRCPNSQNRDYIKNIVFDDNEDADHILNYYRSSLMEVMAKEIFL